ncbi:MAG: tRNA nucleotidyltransferase (CCA-adding enzyme) [Candidatus Nanohaloarchaea archaeon]|jgi:tRNA nucleotidyltransferase (CCA-adding enzyme)
MEWKRLREKVIEENYPAEDDLQELHQKYSEVSIYIEENFGQDTHFAGSASRGTCMKDDRDIDIFVLFQEDTERTELEDQGLEIGKAVFNEFGGEFEIEYAEHPYTKGEIDGYEVEIVPCFDTDPDSIKSSVDRTPHHSRWVKNNLTEEERKDAVILKKFLDTAGLYGSSLKVQGFSGYLCEILIHEYGSFQELVREAVNWSENPVIDPEDHHDGELPEKLRKKFGEESLVIIDPVDEERNVASVLSRENLSRFIFLCWRFRQDPGMKFFQEDEKEYTEFELKQELKKRGELLVLEFDAVEEVDDIVYPQMRKTLRRLSSEIRKKDFRIYEKGFHVDDQIRIFFELDRELPEVQEKKGPKVFHGEEHLSEFTSKYGNVFVKDDTLTAKVEREYTNAKKFVEDFLEDKLEAKGIPENIAEKLDTYSFIGPLEGSDEWLNYLGEKFNVQK